VQSHSDRSPSNPKSNPPVTPQINRLLILKPEPFSETSDNQKSSSSTPSVGLRKEKIHPDSQILVKILKKMILQDIFQTLLFGHKFQANTGFV